MAKSIALEGIDGSGKSTLAALLKDYLDAQNHSVLMLREPGGSAYYEAIRSHIHFSDLERSALSDMLTCAGGIAENIRQTKETLNTNTWVISDRCYISNVVYQIAQGLDSELTNTINQVALQGFDYDIKILIDVPLEVAEKRLVSIGKKQDRWESMGELYFEKVQSLYHEIAQREEFAVLDGTQPLEDLLEQIIKRIE